MRILYEDEGRRQPTLCKSGTGFAQSAILVTAGLVCTLSLLYSNYFTKLQFSNEKNKLLMSSVAQGQSNLYTAGCRPPVSAREPVACGFMERYELAAGETSVVKVCLTWSPKSATPSLIGTKSKC